MRRDDRVIEAAAYAVLMLFGLLATATALVLGIVVMTTKR